METSTLTGLLEHIAGRFPSGREISVPGMFDLTHSRLHNLVEGTASSLFTAVIRPGGVVAVTFPNTFEVRATAASQLNSAFPAEEFEFYLSDAEWKLLLIPKEGDEAVQSASAKLNKSASEFRWLQTGDLGYTGSEGYLHLVSRIKEINRGGRKISPIEVDACLVSHPEMAQAVAFRVPNDKYGEEINCAIIANEGASHSSDTIGASGAVDVSSSSSSGSPFLTLRSDKTNINR